MVEIFYDTRAVQYLSRSAVTVRPDEPMGGWCFSNHASSNLLKEFIRDNCNHIDEVPERGAGIVAVASEGVMPQLARQCQRREGRQLG